MLQLTRQQKLVLITTLFLLLTGWAVKSWRLAHPPTPVEQSAENE